MHRAILCAALLLALTSLPAVAGPVTLLSQADPERPSDTAGGVAAAVSTDGRYVVLFTGADNFLAGVSDANAGSDVFFQDRVAGTTVLVSHAAGDPTTTGDGGARTAALSADGRWVAFVSDATNLVSGQVDQSPLSFNAPDLFLWDRDTGLIQLVSHEAGLPTTAAGRCSTFGGLGISADGSRVAFRSEGDNLVAGQTYPESPDAFLYDRATGVNALISHTSGSATTLAGAGEIALSADGNWVVFASNAPDLVAGQVDTTGSRDVFLHDVSTGANILVSHAAGSAVTTGDGDSVFFNLDLQISADGSRIAYASLATNLMAGQTDDNDDVDVFLYDRAAGTNTLVSHASSSATTAGEQYSEQVSLSADGRHVAYLSGASDLVADDPSPWQDVFVYDHVAGTNLLVSRGSAPSPYSDSFGPRISADGGWIAFLSAAPNLVSGQTDDVASLDAFLWSRATGSITLVTRTPGSATTAIGLNLGEIGPMVLSADGSWSALSCSSGQLIDGIDDYNGLPDAFLYERATGVHHLLTPRGGAVSASAGGQIFDTARTAMSNDGRYILFTSDASNLPGIADGNDAPDIFLHDRIAGTATLVSHANGSPSTTSNGGSFVPLLSADGSVVVFLGFASDLVTGPGPTGQLYLYERTTGQVTLISHVSSSPSIGAQGNLEGGHAVSGDGRWVAFAHTGSLIAGQVDGNSGEDIFLFDRATGTNTLVSHASSSSVQTADGTSSHPSISAESGTRAGWLRADLPVRPGHGDNDSRELLGGQHAGDQCRRPLDRVHQQRHQCRAGAGGHEFRLRRLPLGSDFWVDPAGEPCCRIAGHDRECRLGSGILRGRRARAQRGWPLGDLRQPGVQPDQRTDGKPGGSLSLRPGRRNRDPGEPVGCLAHGGEKRQQAGDQCRRPLRGLCQLGGRPRPRPDRRELQLGLLPLRQDRRHHRSGVAHPFVRRDQRGARRRWFYFCAADQRRWRLGRLPQPDAGPRRRRS
jgi:Tol biopolymer transport system component